MHRWVLAIALIATWCAPARGDDVRAPAPPPPPKRTGVVTRPPRILQAQAPEYPPAALEAGKQARVKVRIHIDATGTVSAVDVIEPVGDGFDEAAVAAAMQYVFEPAEIDGAPAAIAVETTINFVIEHREEPEAPPPPPPEVHTGPPNHAGAIDAPVALQGIAVERGTRRELAGVIVSIAELGLDAVTGDDGTFYFHGVPPGNYKLLAVDPHYDRLERPIALGKREALEVRLWMRPKGGNPYETVVEGEREVLEVTRRTLQRQQLTSVPGHVRRSDPRDPDPARDPARAVRPRPVAGPRVQPRRHRDLRRRPRGAVAVPLPRRPVDLQRRDARLDRSLPRRVPGAVRPPPRRRGRARAPAVAERRHPRLGQGRLHRLRRLPARADHEGPVDRGRRPAVVHRPVPRLRAAPARQGRPAHRDAGLLRLLGADRLQPARQRPAQPVRDRLVGHAARAQPATPTPRCRPTSTPRSSSSA